MMRVDVGMTGNKELQKELDTLASSSINKVMRRPIRSGLQTIRQDGSDKYKTLG